jgi:hypothetical protein
MTTAYTSLLGLALPVTGELSGTWGQIVNDSITSLVDTSVAGTTNVSTDANVTLTTTTGASNQARQAILLFSGARTAIRTVTAPAQSKIYTVINATTGGFAVTLVGAGPTTGVTIANGARTVVAWNGSDFVEVSSPSSIILPGGTANGVLYLNGSKVVTSGSALTFDGANIIVNATTPAYFTGTSNLAQVSINRSPSTGAIFNASQSAAYLNIDGASGGSSFQFVVASAANTQPSEAMRLTSTGLGIGRTSNRDSTKLDVFGDITFGGNASYYGTLGYNAGVGTVDLTSSDGGFRFIRRSGTVTSATLDSSGNLGLGVTPSAWATYKALQVNNGALIGFSTEIVGLTGNAYYNSNFKYISNGYATKYSQGESGSGQHAWFTAPSGTAGNAITFTQAMTLDASGNLLVGATSAAGNSKGYFFANADTSHTVRITNASSGSSAYANLVVSNNLGTVVELGVQSSNRSTTYPANEAWMYTSNGINIGYSGDVKFYTGSAERARIDSSGNLLVGTTTQIFGALITARKSGGNTLVCQQDAGSSAAAIVARIENTSGRLMGFNYAGSDVGTITTNGTITVYNTTSDYRLKNNQAPLTGSGEFIDALKPKTWNWLQDGSKGVGFIAHEFAEVSPSSVTGEKDSVDADGNPLYQAMQASSAEVIANLVAEIQSLRKRLADAGL